MVIAAAAPFAIVIGFAGAAALLWIGVAERAQRGVRTILARVAALPATARGKSANVATMRGKWERGRRLKRFMPQLESALRMAAGSLRVGLSLRQALLVVAEELDDPAKAEFMRVVGATNLGMSILDALDEMADRMPSSELALTVRAIRVQSQTGGDLADLLDSVGDTIKARRTLARKVAALTAEGRMSAYVILALPIGVGIFLALTQRHMGHALLFTTIGQISLAVVVVLETLATVIIMKMLKVEL
ncbi:MAG TPA: type II secretion system F family protein [Candidatus Elarobacter sp.]|nr:type II secretion system F family protein [Candidatus Elarobacter sp.]